MSSFPISVKLFEDFLPHRPPMVWLDEIVEAEAERGCCRVRVTSDRHFFDGKNVRPSSVVEWVAQAYGYTSAYYLLGMNQGQAPKIQTAYLVGIRDLAFEPTWQSVSLNSEIYIHVKRARELGPVSLVDGRVTDSAGALFARVSLKLFASP